MTPKKKKKRQFRQSFARFLQHITPAKSGIASFDGPLDSIAILSQEKLGDCLLLTPLIRNLRQARPDLKIHVITFSKASTAFFSHNPDITAVHQAKKKIFRYFREVLSRRFDLLFNTKDHPSTHFLIQSILVPARFRVGHRNPFHEGLYDRLIDMEYHSHMTLKNCALLSILGIPVSSEECRPFIPEIPVTDGFTTFLRTLDAGPVLGINISAGTSNRLWTEDNWKMLLSQFPGMQFMVLSAPEDAGIKRTLEKSCKNLLPSHSTRNLYEASCIVSKLSLLITPDTSMVHIGSAVHTPVVGLYREAPQDISRFGPYKIPYELVISKTGFVSDIEPAEVSDAIHRLLSRCDINRH